MNEPLTLVEPAVAPVPILFDSPHSGRSYPADFGSRLDLSLLRRAEDAYVDRLLADAPDAGVTLLTARFPRAYIDVNRAVDDIDPIMLAESWPTPLAPSEKSAMGIGLIRAIITPGLEIYDRKLSASEVRGRIERYWRPYRTSLENCIKALHARFGRTWHLHWHSMKSAGNAATPDGPGARRPDIVLGDRHGQTCAPLLLGLVRQSFEEAGYSVALNEPYAGGAIITEYANPVAGIECLQIEVNRALYLDEADVRPTPGIHRLRRDIATLTARLAKAVDPACQGHENAVNFPEKECQTGKQP